MISRVILLFAVVGLLAACSSFTPSRSFTRTAYPDMFSALDSSPDGTEGTIKSTGETFRIKSTHVSQTRLCRLVEIKGSKTFFGESFCKAKGGEWR
jgi:hypothetical protein